MPGILFPAHRPPISDNPKFPDQMVTQALQTLAGDYRNGAVAFTSAELIVKLITRDDRADATDYARAEVWEAEP